MWCVSGGQSAKDVCAWLAAVVLYLALITLLKLYVGRSSLLENGSKCYFPTTEQYYNGLVAQVDCICENVLNCSASSTSQLVFGPEFI